MYKIICIIAILLVISLIILNIVGDKSVIEGLENNVSESDITESQNAAILSKIVMLDDQLMISKYKRQYENMIINMDDYINLMMIQQLLKIKMDSGIGTTIEGLDYLNTLKSAKDSLNVAMKFLDKR